MKLCFGRISNTASLGDLVRRERERQGLSYDEVARRAGVSAVWVKWLEAGRANLDLGRGLRVLHALDVRIGPARAFPDADDVRAAATIAESIGVEDRLFPDLLRRMVATRGARQST